jgi:hypothetical protein
MELWAFYCFVLLPSTAVEGVLLVIGGVFLRVGG